MVEDERAEEDRPGVVRAMGRTPLPSPPPPEPDAIRLVELLLDKRPVDPDLLARRAAPEAVAARTANETQQRADDWPALARYRVANSGIDRPDLVMIGDSITEIWQLAMPELFGEAIVNRGISGQTSPQILLRFMADVVDLRPKRVHILCGTNDIAGNSGPNGPEDYQRNIRAMVDLAVGNAIEPLIASIPPTDHIFWQADARPLEWVPFLNDWLRAFATERRLRFVDYHAALTDGAGALQPRYSADGVHVSREAYRLMSDMLFRPDKTDIAIASALRLGEPAA